MLEAIKFAHEHQKPNFSSIRLQAAFGKKKFVPMKEKEDEAIYAKVKAASYDKTIASKGSAKQEHSSI
jgi:polyribonucleotide nucleotidyltransferase